MFLSAEPSLQPLCSLSKRGGLVAPEIGFLNRPGILLNVVFTGSLVMISTVITSPGQLW